MTFRRFGTWLVEKLFELHFAVAVLLIVKFFLPLTPQSFDSVAAFSHGIAETYRASLDDAAYVTKTFMDGSYGQYAWNTYAAAVYVIVFYGYVSSLYIFTSLLACLLLHKHYVVYALLAYGAGFAIFCLRFVHAYDYEMIRMGVALFVLGLLVVAASARFGAALDARLQPKKSALKTSGPRRIGFELSQ